MSFSIRDISYRTSNRRLSTSPEDFHNMPPPNLNSSAVPTSAVNGNLSLNTTSQNKQLAFGVEPIVGPELTLAFSVLLTATALVGFVGNLWVLHFTNNEEKKPVKARSNLNFFIRSLALSDVLGSLLGVPLVVVMMNSDLLFANMRCKVYRFLASVFVYTTIFNLVVIGIERYICTCRPTSRPLSLKTVKKSVTGAWLFGILSALVFSYPAELTRFDLDSTRYGLSCDYNYDYRISKVMQMLRLLLTYVLPSIFLTITCICIVRTLWMKKVNVAVSNQSQAAEKWQRRRRKATIQLIVIIVAFIVPYLLFNIVTAVKLNLTKPEDYDSELIFSRLVSGVIIYLNSPINFVIHLKQLTGFYQAVKGYFVCCDYYEVEPVQNVRISRVEPKAPAQRKAWEPERRRASMSQVEDGDKRRETQSRRNSR